MKCFSAINQWDRSPYAVLRYWKLRRLVRMHPKMSNVLNLLLESPYTLNAPYSRNPNDSYSSRTYESFHGLRCVGQNSLIWLCFDKWQFDSCMDRNHLWHSPDTVHMRRVAVGPTDYSWWVEKQKFSKHQHLTSRESFSISEIDFRSTNLTIQLNRVHESLV